MQHHRRQKAVLTSPGKHLRRSLTLNKPILFQPTEEEELEVTPTCIWVPRPLYDQDLKLLNTVLWLRDDLVYLENLDGQEGETNPGVEWEKWDGNDVSDHFTAQWVGLEGYFNTLKRAQGPMGRELARHWPRLEAAYRLIQQQMRKFVATYQMKSGRYVAHLEAGFLDQVEVFRQDLGLLWYELEEATR